MDNKVVSVELMCAGWQKKTLEGGRVFYNYEFAGIDRYGPEMGDKIGGMFTLASPEPGLFSAGRRYVVSIQTQKEVA